MSSVRGAPALAALAAVPLFNALQLGEQRERRNCGFDHSGAVHVIGLIRRSAYSRQCDTTCCDEQSVSPAGRQFQRWLR